MEKPYIFERIIEYFASSGREKNISAAMADIVTKQLKLSLCYVAIGHLGLFLLSLFLIKEHPGFVAFHVTAALIFFIFSRLIDVKNFYFFYWITFLEIFLQASLLLVFLGDTFSVDLYFLLMIPIASYALLLPSCGNKRRNLFIATASALCGLSFIHFALLPYILVMPIKLNVAIFMVFKVYYIVVVFGLSALETYFFTRRMISAILNSEEAKTELSARANFDALTGLYNRYETNNFLAEAFSNYVNHGVPLSVCMADIDNFKQINDTCGHNTGDFILKTVAQIMNNNIRKSTDFLGRWGGEEFLLIMPASQRVCFERVEVLRQLIQNTTFEFAGRRISVTLTFGVAAASKNTPTPDALIDLADQMLYKGKRAGRNRTVISQ